MAVDSIFMMPQLGILSTIHAKAAIEVFEKDCLIHLGTCIAPVGPQKPDVPVLTYECFLPNEKIEGKLMPGELKMIPVPFEQVDVKLSPSKGIDIGVGKNEMLTTQIYGGVVGIILDGRGRQPFNLSNISKERIQNLATWSEAANEYPTRGLSDG